MPSAVIMEIMNLTQNESLGGGKGSLDLMTGDEIQTKLGKGAD